MAPLGFGTVHVTRPRTCSSSQILWYTVGQRRFDRACYCTVLVLE